MLLRQPGNNIRMELHPADKQALNTECRICHKRIGSGGSLTSWIFQEGRCQCNLGGAKLKQPSLKISPSQPTANHLDVDSSLPDFGPPFAVLSRIGEGGMGTVYKVRDTVDNKEYAIKVLRPELAADEPSIKRFEQEVKAASLLSHPNLVAVHNFGRDRHNAPYMVMDFIDGENLSDVLAAQRIISVKRAIGIMYQVCEALIHTHSKGIIHRDLKPSNIILTTDANGDEEVKLVDFGIAKVIPSVQQQTQNLTQSGEIFGSPYYMSPEQCTGKALDARSDIYSLGCVMYECLCGHPPFSGENVIQTILQHILDQPPDLAVAENTAITADLHDLVMKCLRKEPQDRYAGAAELMNDLYSVALNRPLTHKRRVKFSPPRRKTGLIIGLVLLLLGVVPLIGWNLVKTTTTQTPDSTAFHPYSNKPFVGDPKDVDPEVTKLLQGLRDAGGADRADLLEELIRQNLGAVSRRGKGHVVVGRVVVNGPDNKDPRTVMARAPIQEGGYFVCDIDYMTEGLPFRLHGYTPVNYRLDLLHLTHHVSWIGRITLEKLPESKLCTLHGTISGDDGFDPRTATITMDMRDMWNKPTNAAYAEVPFWEHLTVHANKNGEFVLPGCSPCEYTVYASAPGRVSTFQVAYCHPPPEPSVYGPLVLNRIKSRQAPMPLQSR